MLDVNLFLIITFTLNLIHLIFNSNIGRLVENNFYNMRTSVLTTQPQTPASLRNDYATDARDRSRPVRQTVGRPSSCKEKRSAQVAAGTLLLSCQRTDRQREGYGQGKTLPQAFPCTWAIHSPNRMGSRSQSHPDPESSRITQRCSFEPEMPIAIQIMHRFSARVTVSKCLVSAFFKLIIEWLNEHVESGKYYVMQKKKSFSYYNKNRIKISSICNRKL